VLGFLLEHMHEAHLTVAVNSSRFGPAVAKFFTRLGDRTGGRVTLVRGVPFVKRAAMFAGADLTVWPAECDNYGFCGLTSLAAGTPVISFALSPQTDYLHQNVNAALVKTKVDYDDNGAPHARPDYDRFAAALQEMIAEPFHINQMQTKVSYNLLARKESFENGWRQILQLL
jgi:glycosyltransferase involved in cell wall biosynthesis